MDIRGWLQNVADREPPGQPCHLDSYSCLWPIKDQFHQQRQGRESHRETYTAIRQQPYDWPSAGHRPRSPCDVVSARERRGLSVTSWASKPAGRGRTGPSRAAVKPYEKQARHKTRPDRYEQKHKKRKREDNNERPSQKSREKRHKRRSKRGEGRTVDLVQSFQLRNGPPHGRLTLKPNNTTGIFKNGRASCPMASRGPGLPDLVFNEMRFLQKSPDRQNEPAKVQLATDHRAQAEDDISAYFVMKAIPENNGRLQEDRAEEAGDLRRRDPDQCLHRDTAPRLKNQPPTRTGNLVRLGRHTERSGTLCSCLRSQPSHPHRPQSITAPDHVPIAEDGLAECHSEGLITYPSSVLELPTCARRPLIRQAIRDQNSNRRSKQEADLDRKGPGLSIVGSLDGTPTNTSGTTDQSLPRLTRRKTIHEPVGGYQHQGNAKNLVGPNTSGILKLRDCFYEPLVVASLPRHVPPVVNEGDKESHDPKTSSSNIKFLRDAITALARVDGDRESPFSPQALHDDRRAPRKRTAKVSSGVLEGDMPSHKLNVHVTSGRRSLAERLPQRTLQPAGALRYSMSGVGNEEMLDVLPNGPDLAEMLGSVQANAREAEELVTRLVEGPPRSLDKLGLEHDWSYQHRGIQYAGTCSDIADDMIWAQGCSVICPSSEGALPPDVNGRLEVASTVKDTPSEIDGFWRPQKLY